MNDIEIKEELELLRDILATVIVKANVRTRDSLLRQLYRSDDVHKIISSLDV